MIIILSLLKALREQHCTAYVCRQPISQFHGITSERFLKELGSIQWLYEHIFMSSSITQFSIASKFEFTNKAVGLLITIQNSVDETTDKIIPPRSNLEPS